MKKIALITAIILLLALTLGTLVACQDIDAPPSESKFLKADGIRLVDAEGNPVGLYGTNLGGWFVQEGWMCPNSAHGDFAQIDIMLTLYNRFGQERAETLIDVYEDNWVSEIDFANLSALGLNCVRIPFGYFNLMNALTYDESTETWVKTPFEDLTWRDDAFEKLDWALEMCEKYGLYAILDLHGAVGSQSGQDHSGDISAPTGRLWNDDEIGQICRDKTKELWVEVATRYKEVTCIAAYDILNEPGIATIDGNGNKSQITDKKTWDYFDELVKAIREVDTNHIICVESCWEAQNLPSPETYGWENMLYQYHQYNWDGNDMSNAGYYGLKVFTIDDTTIFDARTYPVLIGEFNVWVDYRRASGGEQTDAEAWAGVIELYCGKGWSFTTWNFKYAGSASWGLYNFDYDNDYKLVDFYNDSYDYILDAWASHNSANYEENTYITNCIKPYLADFYTGEQIKATTEQYYILNNLEQ